MGSIGGIGRRRSKRIERSPVRLVPGLDEYHRALSPDNGLAIEEAGPLPHFRYDSEA